MKEKLNTFEEYILRIRLFKYFDYKNDKKMTCFLFKDY